MEEGVKNIKRAKGAFRFFILAGLVIVLPLFVFIFINQPLKPTLVVIKEESRLKVDSPLEIQFDWPVARQVNITIEPAVTGEVAYKNMIIGQHFSRTVVFTPELNFWPDTTYQVRVSNVKSVLPSLLPAREYVYTFTTESVPKIKSLTPEVVGEIRADQEFKITLDKKPANLAEYEYRFLPAVDYDTLLSEEGKTVTLKPKSLLSQGQTYQLSVWQKKIRNFYQKNEAGFRAEPESIWTGNFAVREAPFLSGFSPKGENVGLNAEITAVFNEPVETASFKESLSITPALSGDWRTEDQKTFVLKEATLAKDTDYKVLIRRGLKTLKGGYFTEDATHTFKTIGPVEIARFSPADGAAGVSVSHSFSVTFNQAVDKTSAQSHFSLEPAAAGDFLWSGETLTFKPKASLAFNTTYHLTISKGVKSLSGFDSEEDYKTNFTTELSLTKLAVPFHRQEHNLSCETATLVMALAYRGVSVSEAAIIDYIGFDPTPKSGGVWGNPNVAFVGDIDGHQPSTGYGVYWDPITRAADQYRSAYDFTGWNISDLTAEIKKGNPVIVWGTAGSGARIDWKTPAGGNVVAVSGEHTRVVVGFIGSAENPSKIITLDPLSGEKYFTLSSFLWNWGLLGRSGVVVE